MEHQTTSRVTFGPERLNAVTDGVFAIILTLLVLELKLPDLEAGDNVLLALADNRHVFIAWLISFLAIARFWIVHHAITTTLVRVHGGTIARTFIFLGAASLMPFTSDVLGNARIAEPWSTVMFAANFALVSLALGLLAQHAAREPSLVSPDAPTSALTQTRHHHLVVLPVVSLVAAGLAFTHPYLALGVLSAEFVVVAWRGLRAPRVTAGGDSPRRALHPRRALRTRPAPVRSAFEAGAEEADPA